MDHPKVGFFRQKFKKQRHVRKPGEKQSSKAKHDKGRTKQVQCIFSSCLFFEKNVFWFVIFGEPVVFESFFSIRFFMFIICLLKSTFSNQAGL